MEQNNIKEISPLGITYDKPGMNKFICALW